MTQASNIARRAFLQRMGQLSVAGTAAPWALNLAAISDAAAFTNDGYKALVCIFLYGGNDHAECEDEHSGPWQGNQGNANNDERQSDAEQDLQHVRIFYRRRGRQRDVHSYAALR